MLTLDRSAHALPLYRQIYQQLQNQIRSGDLPAGSRLTPTRELASSLHIGRNTAEIAYQQLCAEGYVDSRAGSGYYVLSVPRMTPPPPSLPTPPPPPRSPEQKIVLEYGRFRPDRFPSAAFQKAQSHALQQAPIRMYCPPTGLPDLQRQLQIYLQRARGVRCRPEQIIISSGTQPLIDLICQLLRHALPSLHAAMEDPGYDGVRQALENNGCPPAPIALEEDGICVGALQKAACNLIYLTPSHQFPLGAALPIQKRMQLIRWAQERNAFLIEDDYDSEFRYSSLPIPSLQSLWPDGRVLYLGTMSKILSPGLRLSYLVLPPCLAAPFQRYFSSYHCPVSTFLQQALADMMAQGQWNLHLRRLVQYNRRIHDGLVAALAPGAGSLYKMTGHGAGLHFVLRPLSPVSEEQLLQRGRQQEMQLYPLSPYYQSPAGHRGIVVGFGTLAAEQVDDVAQRLIRVFSPDGS